MFKAISVTSEPVTLWVLVLGLSVFFQRLANSFPEGKQWHKLARVAIFSCGFFLHFISFPVCLLLLFSTACGQLPSYKQFPNPLLCPPIAHSFFLFVPPYSQTYSLIPSLPSCALIFFLLLFAWCSAGEPRGREIIQSLCILQALWSAAEPRCTDTLVYLDWPSKQPTPWQIAWMLPRAHTHTHTHTYTHTHTHTHTGRKDICRTHTLPLSVGWEACVPAEQTALKKSSTKKKGGKKMKAARERGSKDKDKKKLERCTVGSL